MIRRSRISSFRRSGCTTCKQRHKKCDEQKPRCGNCTRLDLECKPSELFRASKLSHNDSRKSSCFHWSVDLVSDESAAPCDLTENLDVFENIDNEYEVESPTSTSTSPSTGNELSPPRYALTHLQSQALSIEPYLLHHYTFKMSALLVNVDSPSNPLRSVLLPRAVTSPILMDALYATSALNVSVGNSDSNFRMTSLAYYNKAASALQHFLADVGNQTKGTDLEILLLISVFLCKYEIISGGASNWRSHLQGVQKMLDFSQENNFKLAPETVSYVQSFITYHSHIAGITRSEALPFSTMTHFKQGGEESERSLPQIDPYMGVSGNFISLLHAAADTILLDPAEPSNLSVMMGSAIKIYRGIKFDVQASTLFDLSSDLTPEIIDCLDYIASAYRNAIIAYLHTILDAIDGNATTDEITLQCIGMRSLLVVNKEEAVSACVQDTLCVPDEKSCAVGLVPLLFIVASETRNRTEFDIASQRLSLILKTACLGNIATALELLHKIQQARSADWRQVLKGFEYDLIVT